MSIHSVESIITTGNHSVDDVITFPHLRAQATANMVSLLVKNSEQQPISSVASNLNPPARSNVVPDEQLRMVVQSEFNKLVDIPDNSISHVKIESAVIKLIEKNTKEDVEQGESLNIRQYSTEAIKLLTSMLFALLQLSKAEAARSGLMAKLSYASAESAATLTKKEGLDLLLGAIGQSALMLGLTVAGTFKAVKALKQENTLLKNNMLTHDNLKTDISSLKEQLTSSELSPESRAEIIKTLENKESGIEANKQVLELGRTETQKGQVMGNATMNLANPVGSLAYAAGQAAAATTKSDAMLANASKEYSDTNGHNANDVNRQELNSIQELIHTMDTILQTINATNSYVAGNRSV